MPRSRRFGLVVFGLSALAAVPAATSARAWPWFLVIRGPGLLSPAILSRSATALHGDVIVFYSSLTPGPLPADYAGRPHYDVAAFEGPEWIPSGDSAQANRVRREARSLVSKIYRGTRTLPAVWVGRWQGRDNTPLVIGDSGQMVLERAGVKLRWRFADAGGVSTKSQKLQ